MKRLRDRAEPFCAARERHLLRRLLKPAILVTGAFAGGACAGVVGATGGSAHADAPFAMIEQLGRVLVEVENDYVDPVERTKLVEGAIKGMVAELDPHSSYMPPDEFRAFEDDTQGAFGGIGIEVDSRNGELVVLSPIEGAPAERAGVLSGDVIVNVDGRDPSAEPLDHLVKRLRGVPGTSVKIGVRRAGQAQVLFFQLTREIVHVRSVASRLLVGHVAYIRVRQFQEHTHDELLAAVAKLRQRASMAPTVGTGAPNQLSGVLFDLRSDPGGLVDEAADVADEFLEGGVIYTTRHRGTVVDQVEARPGGALTGIPVVVLVNQYTASASELVAGALQDQKRAVVVGEQTFGKGSVQAILGLPGGAGMRLTVSRYYTPSGHAIQADGVHPDVAVEMSKGSAVSFRERDLAGHLAPEANGPAPRPPQAIVVATGDAGAVDDETGSEARNVPEDPSTSDDVVLKVGFQRLRQAIDRPAASH